MNIVFVSGQAIREASLTVLRPTVHGSEVAAERDAASAGNELDAKHYPCGLAASSGVLNPPENKTQNRKK